MYTGMEAIATAHRPVAGNFYVRLVDIFSGLIVKFPITSI